MCVFCSHVGFSVCACVCVCVCACVCVCVCVFAESDLWGLSSTASSLSLLAWRMNGPLSTLPQPLLLVSLSLALSLSHTLSLSLKLPFFLSVLPSLYYLISPHAPSSACTLSSSLPFTSRPLTRLMWSFISSRFRDPASPICHIFSVDPRRARKTERSSTSDLISAFRDTSFQCGAYLLSIYIPSGSLSWKQSDTWFISTVECNTLGPKSTFEDAKYSAVNILH